ncbi:class I SAM-dependent methyltransferase [Deltaproteobacteria bacterium TL4]
MSFYSEQIFPVVLDWMMSRKYFNYLRKEVLASASGTLLEIGFGTGLNLPYYPAHVQKILTVDKNAGMNKLAQKRIQASSVKVEHHVLNGEHLPWDAATFDCVVSTWTLCSILQVEQALQEVHRVLKPGGQFLFVEHGLSEEPQVQTWQHRLNSLQKTLGDGCHLNRDISTLISSRFQIQSLKKFYLPKTLRIAGYTYQGIALKQSVP